MLNSDLLPEIIKVKSYCYFQENLTIPSVAIAEYLKSKDFKKTVYCVTCPETVNILEANGFKCKYGVSVFFSILSWQEFEYRWFVFVTLHPSSASHEFF